MPHAGPRSARSLFDSVRLALLAALVGTVAAYGALGFIVLIALVQQVFFGFGHDRFYTELEALPAWRVVLAPTLGGLLVGLFVWRCVPGARSYGPADVMHGIQRDDGRLPIGVGIGSALASALSIGAGASVGRYGPAVHLGASLSAWLAERLRLDRGRRIALVGSGVAAAIAASFNAPLGGILFAAEVMLGGRALRSFVPVTVAAVVGTAVARTHGNDFHLFDLSVHEIRHLHEYLFFAVTGVACGALSVVLMRSMSWSTRVIESSPIPQWLRPMIGGLLLGLLGLQVPHVLGLGDEVIWHTFLAAFPVVFLLALVALKVLATSISFGFGFSGGVFAPALFVGAVFGGAVGAALSGWLPDLVSSPAIYALAGMGAVASCVVGAPVATVLIAFELTSSYALATAVMVAVVMAHLVSRRIFPHSYFTHQLDQRGVDLDVRREVQIMRSRRLDEVLSDRYHRLAPTTTVAEAASRYLTDPDMDLFVLDDDDRLVGQLMARDLILAERTGSGARAVESFVVQPSLVLPVDSDLHETMSGLEGFLGWSVPVVDSSGTRHLVGVIYENAIVNAYNEAVEQARAEEDGTR